MNPGRVFDIVAIVCFGIASIPQLTPPVNMTALGLVFFALGHIFP